MNRRSYLATLGAGLASLAGCSGGGVGRPTVTPDERYRSFTRGGAWPAVRADDRHTGTNPDSAPSVNDVGVAWTHSLDDVTPGVGPGGSITAVVTDDRRLFCGSRSGHVTCIDGRTGERLWRRNPAGGGEVVSLRVADGGLYVAAGRILARLASGDGATAWALSLPGDVTATLLTDDTAVYATCLRRGGPYLGVVQAVGHDGAERWTRQFEDATGVAVARRGDELLVVSEGYYPTDRLTALGVAGGQTRWEVDLPRRVHTARPPVVTENHVLVPVQFSPWDVELLAADEDGVAWRQDLAKTVLSADLTTTRDAVPGQPVLADGTLYVPDMAHDAVYRLNAATGAYRGAIGAVTGGDPVSGRSSLGTAGGVLFGADHGSSFSVSAATPDGNVRWTRQLPNRDGDEHEEPVPGDQAGEWSALFAVPAHGQLYVASGDSGDVFAFGESSQH